MERSVKNIIQELCLIESNLERFFLAYYSQNCDKSIHRFCSEMKKERIDVPWESRGTIGPLSSDFLETVTTASCWKLHYFVVSGSNRVLNKVGTPFAVEEAVNVVRKSSASIEEIEVSLVWGFPFATIEDFYETVLCSTTLMSMSNVEVSMTLLSPIPSSRMYREYCDSLRFDRNFISKLTYPLGGVISNYQELIGLVQSYPKIFSPYYYFDHKDFEGKARVIQKLIEKEKDSNRALHDVAGGGLNCQTSL